MRSRRPRRRRSSGSPLASMRSATAGGWGSPNRRPRRSSPRPNGWPRRRTTTGRAWSCSTTTGASPFASRDQLREAATLIRQAAALAEESGDPALYMAVAGSSYVFYLLGEYDEATAMCDRAIELAAGDPTVGANITTECPLAQCLMQKGGILCDLGRLDEGREMIERGAKIAAEQGATETI